MNPNSLEGRTIVAIGLGDVGGTLAARLAADGADVVGVRRGAEAPAGVRLVRGDARDADVLAALPDAPDAVVVCVTPSAYDEAGYRAGYADVARAVAERYRGAPPGCVLWVSSTAVYGPDSGDPVDDDSAPAPEGFRGNVMLEAEAALAELETAFTAVRSSGIYGPGRHALLKRVLEGRGAPATPVQVTNRIHRDDLVGVLAFLLARHLAGEAVPETVLATDPNPSPRHEVLGWLGEQLGVALRPDDGGPSRVASRRLLPKTLPALGYEFLYPDYRSGFEQVIAEAEASGVIDELREAAAR